jgi:hypothetical protein
LITTTGGYIGLAPEEVDVVGIMYGCTFPVVLRPCGGYYYVIGELIEVKKRGDPQEMEIILC